MIIGANWNLDCRSICLYFLAKKVNMKQETEKSLTGIQILIMWKYEALRTKN